MDSALTPAVVDYLAHLFECRPLQTRQEALAATALVDSLGLPSHHDAQKNWDTFKCIAYVASLGDLEAPVLDAGSGARVVAPRWLHQLGYKAIYACDIQGAQKELYKSLGLRFSVQDLTATNYENGFFQAVTCISVIEHNVPLDAFAKEMARILRPGGLLLVSTDYWSEPIDCSGIYPYGFEAGEMKIIDPEELTGFVKMAEAAGMELCEPLQFATTEKAIRWERVDRDYTFTFVAMRKTGG
jgi:SAM-dependent methyltransferase